MVQVTIQTRHCGFARIGALVALACVAVAQESTADLARKILATRDPAEVDALVAPPGVLTADLIEAVSAPALAAVRKPDLDEAMRIDAVALRLAEKTGDPKLRSKYALRAAADHDTAADVAGSAELARIALDSAKRSDDNAMVVAADLRLCSALRRQSDFPGAEAVCREALDIALKSGLKVDEARARNGLSSIYTYTGQLRQALEHLQIALKLAEAAGEKMGVAFLDNNIGQILWLQGSYADSLGYFERSLKLKREFGRPADQIGTLNNIGLVYEQLGDLGRAAKVFAEDLEMCEKSGDRNCRPTILNNIATVEFAQGKLKDAAAHFRDSAELARAPDKPEALANLAEVLGAMGDLKPARDNADRALKLARETGNLAGEWRAVSVSGEVAQAEGDLAAAEKWYRQAVDTAENLMANAAGGEQDRQRYFEQKLKVWRGLSEVLVAQGRIDDSFDVAEKSRARILREVLASGRLRVDKGLTEEERAREAALRQRMSSLNLDLARETAEPRSSALRVNALRRQLDDARAEYSEFEAALYSSHGDLRLQRSEIPAAPATAIAAALDRKTAAIEYILGENTIYAYVVCGGDPKVHFFKLSGTPATLKNQAKDFARRVAERNLDFAPPGRELYRRLVEPLRSILAGKTSLVIVPDQELWQVPFQALMNSQGRYLVQDFGISYVPSMTVLCEMNRRYARRIAHAPELLALGNPKVTGEAALPQAEREVAGIAESYGASHSRVLTGARATETFVKENAGRYDVLHLAAHGSLDEQRPLYSHIVLSPAAGEDGFLEAWELMKLNLKEEVVVLSACQTAAGGISQGEGLIGMSWALFVAGAPTTVAGLWKVDSASTTKLMLDFHRALRERLASPGPALAGGLTKSEALRRAMLDLMKEPEFRHPFYWAGFVMFGHGF